MSFNDYWKEKAAKRRKSWAGKAQRFAEQYTQLERIRKVVYLPLDYAVGFDFEDYKPEHFVKLNPITSWIPLAAPRPFRTSSMALGLHNAWQNKNFCFSEEGLRAALKVEGADMNSFGMSVNHQPIKGSHQLCG